MFLIQPTAPAVNQNLMELLILIDTCKRASAERITVVLPYFGYARQDRKDSGRVPITAKLVANLITTAGADRVTDCRPARGSDSGVFRSAGRSLYGARVLDDYFRTFNIPASETVIISPDEGSIKRAMQHVENLGGSLAIIDKRRSSATETRQANLIGGDIEGKVAFLFDDMISTAGSICGAARIAQQFGAKKIYIGATHGVFCGNASANLAVCADHRDRRDRFAATASGPGSAESQAGLHRPDAG